MFQEQPTVQTVCKNTAYKLLTASNLFFVCNENTQSYQEGHKDLTSEYKLSLTKIPLSKITTSLAAKCFLKMFCFYSSSESPFWGQ